MSDPDAVARQFWTPESLHAFLAIWRGEDGAKPDWWVYWDYTRWEFFLVDRDDPDWWKGMPGATRGLCLLGDLGDPMPDVPYLMGEPHDTPQHFWWQEQAYTQLEMDL